MANVIKHKRGSGSDPSASDLILGELAIRTDTGKLFTKMDSGAIAEIAGGGSDIAINTLSSSSATGGGSATFNGSAYRFTLSAPPSVSAQQLLVSINGVIQKPVAGTGQPSEGFSVDGTDIILGDAPATGSDFFILTFKSLGVSEPADNSVTSAKIVDGAIVNADINASAAIDGSKINPNFTSNLEITANSPSIKFNESDSNPDYQIKTQLGVFKIKQQGGSDQLSIASDGTVDVAGNLDVGAGLDVTGAIKSTGNISLDSSSELGVFEANTSLGFTNSAKLSFDFSSNLARIRSSGNGSFSARPLTFNMVNTEAMRIDTSANVGIGTTSPNQLLEVANSSGGATISISTDEQAGSQASKKYNNLDFTGYNNNVMARIQSWDESSSTGHGYLTFFTNKNGVGFTEKLRIDPDGNVGIGTTSPSSKLHISSGTSGDCKLIIEADTDNDDEADNPLLVFRQDGGIEESAVGMGFTASNENHLTLANSVTNGGITFATGTTNGYTNAVERMRLDTAGRLMIGTTTEGHSNADDLTVNNSGNCGITIRSGSSSDGNIFFSDDTSGNGETKGVIKYKHADDALVFNSNGNERMRLDSSGNLLFNRTETTISSSSHGFVLLEENNNSVFFLHSREANGTHNTAEFYGLQGAFKILGDGDVQNTNNSYGQLSDVTLKQDIVDASSQWDDIKAIRVRKFRFKDNPTGDLQIGVVAQELETVSPKLVTEVATSSIDTNSTERVKAVKYSVLYMKAIKALQEAQVRIETLETKVEALEAK